MSEKRAFWDENKQKRLFGGKLAKTGRKGTKITGQTAQINAWAVYCVHTILRGNTFEQYFNKQMKVILTKV